MKLRLLVDAHVFDEAHQGTRTYIKGIYTELISSGDSEIEFFFCAKDTENLRREFGEHHNVNYLQLNSSGRATKLIFEFSWLIRKHKIDVAHFQYISPVLKLCKEIVTIHDVLFLDYPNYFPAKYRIMRNFLFRRSAERSDLTCTVSEFSRQAISRHFEIPVERILLTPNAVSKEFFKEIENSRKNEIKVKYGLRNYILYVSRIEPRKNQTILVRAFCELELYRKGYDLAFIGRTDLEAIEFTKYLATVDEQVRQHIRVFENIPFDELNTFYKSCELFVYPSLAEGFGIPPLEAAASQCPVLCSNATAMNDFGFFGDALFDPADLDQLKDKILKMLGNRNDDETRRIQNIVRTKYAWKNIAMYFLEAVKKMN